jgi:hypothetical protein
VGIGAALALSTAPPSARTSEVPAVPLEVEFKLTDLDYKPIASVPVRVTFGPSASLQDPDSGTRFVTSAAGDFRFSTTAPVEAQPKTPPTNFVDSLSARPQPADHLVIAAELPYLTFRWLYVGEVWRFRNGDVLTEGVSVYTPDERGHFTRKTLRSKDGGWLMADLKGLALTTPGHDMWDYKLEPAGSAAAPTGWKLRLAFKRSPPPIRR